MWKKKLEFINVLSNEFKKNNYRVLQGESDTDTLTVSETLATKRKNEAAVTQNNIEMGNKTIKYYNQMNHFVEKRLRNRYTELSLLR